MNFRLSPNRNSYRLRGKKNFRKYTNLSGPDGGHGRWWTAELVHQNQVISRPSTEKNNCGLLLRLFGPPLSHLVHQNQVIWSTFVPPGPPSDIKILPTYVSETKVIKLKLNIDK
ncbi:uncharacterized protein EV154DRAFT_485165 [Mucor mucedo]|uniref:uncharacterized protein n=1 Tax=Mucor mucedo TaxID=29922 RepID=UPI00221FE518|nr:uncharacterized protein EV154DRAFT_485165 [Mucor mucedo]KAI7886413.1 hypothetical protein EV154DRAFT_485165 [Mucor mucedo]